MDAKNSHELKDYSEIIVKWTEKDHSVSLFLLC